MAKHASLPGWDEANTEQKLTVLQGLVQDLYRYVLADKVNAVIEILQAHTAADEKEARDVQLMLTMCRTYPNILSSNCAAGHITGSALVVDAASHQLLLNYHPKFDKWLQFGGHPEYETVPWQVALREAQEETSLPDLYFYPTVSQPKPLDIDAHIIAPRGQQPQHYHLDFRYLLLTARPELAKPSIESKEIKWVSFAAALAMDLEPSLVRLIKKAREILEQPPTR